MYRNGLKCIQSAILANKHVALYGAGSDAEIILKQCPSDVMPVCICDKNENKQHTELLGIEILSLDEALKRWPDLELFIATHSYKYEIIAELTITGSFPANRIINYEDVEYRVGCEYGDSGFTVFQMRSYRCWYDERMTKKERPSVLFGNDYQQNISEYIKMDREIVEGLKKGIETKCSGCRHLTKRWYPKNLKINLLTWAEFNDVKCNFNCSYCSWHPKTIKHDKNAVEMDFPKLISELDKLGCLERDHCTAVFLDGEISIHPCKNAFYETVEKMDLLYEISTNSGIYDEEISALLRNRPGHITVSVDAGTNETFFKTKGVDCFEKVKKNLKQYSDNAITGGIILKYILAPDLNCNKEDIEGFSTLCAEIKPEVVSISYDYRIHHDEVSKLVLTARDRLVSNLECEGIHWMDISGAIKEAVC